MFVVSILTSFMFHFWYFQTFSSCTEGPVGGAVEPHTDWALSLPSYLCDTDRAAAEWEAAHLLSGRALRRSQECSVCMIMHVAIILPSQSDSVTALMASDSRLFLLVMWHVISIINTPVRVTTPLLTFLGFVRLREKSLWCSHWTVG